ncbi:MAG TPA: hypothetical protein VJN72_07705 [Gaiellales bacterium]|nr:hypothetical protein [Gaiellales bacterium]
MHGVVNRLTFADPVDAALAARFRDGAMTRIAAAGCREAYVVQTGERELHLVLLFDDAAAADRVMREVGSPWMREHVVGLLAGPTDRRTGEVIASLP